MGGDLVLLFLSLSEQLFTKEVTNEGNRDTSNTVSYRESTELAEFLHSVKKLEEETWYRNLGLLVFALAILIAADLLYNFPSAPIAAGAAKSIGFGLLRYHILIFKLHITWYILIGCILFLHTIIYINFTIQTRPRHSQSAETASKLRTWKVILNIFGYIVIIILLAGNMCHNILFRLYIFWSRQ